MNPPIDRARREFTARFGAPPAAVAAAPGRVNLIGEHTDYNGGFVLPIAIDRSIAVALSPAAGGDCSTLVAADLGMEHQADLRGDLAPLPRESPQRFANYVLGVIAGFRDRGAAISNINLLAAGDLPVGAGLSSSAAVEVAAATALESLLDITLDPLEKATLCQRAEQRFAGTPCGIMDMMISILGVEDHALLIDCRSHESKPIPLPPETHMTLLVCDTGMRHELAAGEYAQRRATCEAVAAALGVRSLRDATLAMIEEAASANAIDAAARNKAAHVVLENVRTLLAAQALVENDISSFCDQMFESHKSLRNLYEVSCPELDCIVDTAVHVREALDEPRIGARMTGGGFGGCAIIACPAGHGDAVRHAVAQRFEERFGAHPGIFAVRASAGAR